MQEISLGLTGGLVALDVCRACQFVWFDPREFEAMPPAPVPVVPVDRTPQAVKEAVAIMQVQQMARRQAEAEPELDDLRSLPALLGLPVETDPGIFQQRPWLTWAVALLIALVSVGAFFDHRLIVEFALVPAKLWRYGGLTTLTSFFLHGGIWHLLSNLYFLVVFGDNVEDYLGRRRWLLLLLLATLGGDVLHVLGDPRSALPCIGASGGISGLLAFYAFRFPQARLGMRWWARYSLRANWFTFPAWGGFAVWMGLQLFGVMQQFSGFSHVSSLAHLGGALVGVACWFCWRRIEVPPEALPKAQMGEAPPVPPGTE
jgi:membrane associated rhomboid family serine protease